jgi:hypothetical protein
MLASGKLPPDALPGDLAGQVCLFDKHCISNK